MSEVYNPKMPKKVEKAARALTMDVIARHEVPDAADVNAITEAGWYTRRKRVQGMDGLVVGTNKNEEVPRYYVAAPRKYDPAKRQRCTVYTWDDIESYNCAIAYVMEGDFKSAEFEMTCVKSKRLLNDVDEAIERYMYEQRMKEKEEAMKKTVKATDVAGAMGIAVMNGMTGEVIHEAVKPEPEPAHEPEPEKDEKPEKPDVIETLYKLLSADEALGFEDKRAKGGALWLTGDTKPYRKQLKACGMKYSAKRRAWWTKEVA